MPIDYDEIIGATHDAIVADTALTDILGMDYIFQGEPDADMTPPFIHWVWDRDRRNLSAGGAADWTITMRVFASAMSICRDIEGVLAENWQIPTQRAAGVASDNHRLTELLLLNSVEIAGIVRLDPDFGDLRMLVLNWTGKTRKETSA